MSVDSSRVPPGWQQIEITTGVQRDLPGWMLSPTSDAARSERMVRAGCLMVHGLGEHSGRYQELAEYLASRQIATLVFDQQGHGSAPGRRGAPRSYDSMLEDIDRARGCLRDAIGGVPQFLLGHSMGGNLVVNYLLRWPHDVSGAVLLAPMVLPKDPPKRDQIFAAWLTGKLLPFVRIKLSTPPHLLTHDHEQIEKLIGDTLLHHKMSLRLGTQLLAQGRWSLDHASELTTPLLVLHGEEDALATPSASHALCVRAGSQAEYVPLPGLYHGLHYETQRQRIFGMVGDWLEHQSGDATAQVG